MCGNHERQGCPDTKKKKLASASIILVTNELHEVVMLKQHYLSEIYRSYVAGDIKPGETAEETVLSGL